MSGFDIFMLFVGIFSASIICMVLFVTYLFIADEKHDEHEETDNARG
jgi:hypothetical protein